MKKIIFFLFAIAMIACKNEVEKSVATATDQIKEKAKTPAPPKRKEMYASEISINFVGDYKGSVPCSDCDGIDINLTVNNDQTYSINGSLKGKKTGSFKKEGKYIIKNYIIELDHDIDQAKYFYIQDKGLYVLNEKKQQIAGSVKEDYLIIKK